jgi:hypothetical protein
VGAARLEQAEVTEEVRVGHRVHGQRRLLVVHVWLRERLTGDAGVPEAQAPAQEFAPIADAEDDERLVAVGPLPDLRVVAVLAQQLRERVAGLHGALHAGEVAPDNDEEPLGRIPSAVRH